MHIKRELNTLEIAVEEEALELLIKKEKEKENPDDIKIATAEIMLYDTMLSVEIALERSGSTIEQ